MKPSRPSRARAAESPFLEEYRRKRDFAATPEPAPSSHRPPPRGKKSSALAFVVQKHDATRMHYDLRIEIAGAMMSWAVPKGPSYDPAVKRLAVETEDHPMEYNAFEGRIPDGAYGAGDVLLWDRGTYETIPPGEEALMRERGNFKLRLFGEKLQGEWHVVRTRQKAAGNEQWILFKAKDAFADPAYDVVSARPGSILTGRSATRGPLRVGASAHGRSARDLIVSMGAPCQATTGPLAGPPGSYRYEIKYDGYRLLAGKAGHEVRLLTRRQNDWTDRFPQIGEAVARLGARELVIDGEACAIDARGRPSFSLLQGWLSGERTATLIFAVFDLLSLDGRDVRKLPLEERRELLEALLAGAPPPICLSAAIDGELGAVKAAARAAGLEGLIAKRKGSTYASGASRAWFKIKFDQREDFVVCGYAPERGARGGADDLGAVLLAQWDPDAGGQLVYMGKVGTGWDSQERKSLLRRLLPLRVDTPLVDRDRLPRGSALAHVTWCRPELVVHVAFAEYTRDGSVRHPRYLGVREDVRAEDCCRIVAPPTATEDATSPAPAPVPRKAAAAAPRLSNPDKVMYPDDGITKRDVLDYYESVAPVLLPHLAGRPINFQRWVDGIAGKEWYQHRVPANPPDYVRRIPFEKTTRIIVDAPEALAWLVNFAALTFHQWTSHAPPGPEADVQRALAQPDYVVLDLDPATGTYPAMIRIALAIRKLLDALELASFVKTTGKRGLHVMVPLARGHTHAQATAFAEQVAGAVARVLPDVATVERRIDKRGSRVYVDFGQNGMGRTIVSPYTLRALPGAPVSTPLRWSEVTEKLDPRAFTLRNIRKRIDKHGDLLAGALEGRNVLPATS